MSVFTLNGLVLRRLQCLSGLSKTITAERDIKHYVVLARLNTFSLRASVKRRRSSVRHACHYTGKFESLHCTFVHNARSYLRQATGERNPCVLVREIKKAT